MQSVNDWLMDQSIRHAVDLQRFSNGVVQRIIAKLNASDVRLYAELVQALEGMQGTAYSIERLESLLGSVRATNAAAYEVIGRELTEELRRFTEYEASYQAQALRAAVPVQVSVAAISPVQAFTAAYAQPFRVSKDGAVPMAQYLAALTDARAKQVRDAVSLGWLEGETTDSIVRRIRGTKARNFEDGMMEGSRRHLEGIVRTATNHMANVTQQKTLEANQDIVKGWAFHATMDGRTSITCASLNGKVFPVGKGPIPPLHINCLPGDSRVLSRCGISGASKRWFDGELIVINTATGRKLSCTPNHPVLTGRGWVAAQSIDLADEVICDGGREWSVGADGDNKNVIASIHDVAESFLCHGEVASVPVPLSSPDFHGDASDGDIAVIGAYRNLGVKGDADGGKHISQGDFVVRGPRLAARKANRALKQFLLRARDATQLLKCKAGEVAALIFAHGFHARPLLFAPISCLDSSQRKGSLNSSGANADFLGDPGDAYPRFKKSDCNSHVDSLGHKGGSWDSTGLEAAIEDGFADSMLAARLIGGARCKVFSDAVIKTDRVSFSGHVYNLETAEGWYSANGIVTHNCRSAAAPVVKSFRELGIDIPEVVVEGRTRATLDGQIPADTTFTAWLKSKPAAFQDEILGSTRGKLFRANAIEIDRFTNNKGKVYTLDQLRERDAALFKKAGL